MTDQSSNSEPPQLGEADLTSMTPDQINQARRAGQFTDLLAIKTDKEMN